MRLARRHPDPEAHETLRVALAAPSAKTGPEDERTARARRHDGLAEIAGFYLAHQQLADSAGQRPRVVVTIPIDLLLAQREGQPAPQREGQPTTPGTPKPQGGLTTPRHRPGTNQA